MKKSKDPASTRDPVELEFPDWTEMDDSSIRITPEAAFRLCEYYPLLLGKKQREARDHRSAKCFVEFEL